MIMDNNGYVMGLVSFLMIIPTILLLMVFINMGIEQTAVEQSNIGSNDVLSVTNDIETNLPIIAREVLKNKSIQVVKSGNPLTDSRKEIKDDIQYNMDNLCLNYESEGFNTKCEVFYVNNSQKPFEIQVVSKIKVEKGSIKHQVNLTQNISLINGSYLIMDPLPFVKCKEYGGATVQDGRTYYGSSLSEYLKSKGVNNSEAYENATSPLYFRKCPYDPYELHGDTQDMVTLKNCIDNGYYHESNDGACFFCRLEGKGTCPHYGMETFIVPDPFNSSSHSNSSLNISTLTSASSPDHVIFNDSEHGTYSGREISYYSDGNRNFHLFLDNSHRMKYGLPTFKE